MLNSASYLPITARSHGESSLKRKITLGILVIFLAGIWAMSYYVTLVLQDNMQFLLADQQVSTVSLVASEINHELTDRVQALEKIALSIDQPLLNNPNGLQQLLEQRPIFLDMFNSGVVVVALDGTALAEAPTVAGRRGTNYASNVATHSALVEGKTVIGRPVVGRVLRQPLFNINVPIRDAQGRVIGAIFGVINLAKPNFLDRLGEHRYGKSGGYLVIAPQHNLIVTATDKTRVMQPLPVPGANKVQDMRMQGFDGTVVAKNSMGIEVLSSSSRIPVAGWYVVATLPTEEAFAPIRNLKQHILVATVLLTLVAGILSLWLLHQQFKPLVAAVEDLAAMSDASKPLAPLTIRNRDEIGRLIAGFNQLLETLRLREEQLQAERNFFSALLQQSSDGVFLFSPNDLAIQEANPSLCKMLGYERNELLSLKFSDLTDTPLVTEQDRAGKLVSQTFCRAGERNYRRQDDSWVPMEESASLVETSDRQLIMVNLRDLSQRTRERKEMQLELAAYSMKLDLASRRLLVMQEETKRRLAAELHDRTSPNLAAIGLNLNNVVAALPQERSQELVERLDDTRALIEDTNASIREICSELRPTELDYAGLAAALNDYAHQFSRRTGIRVQVSCAQGERLSPELESLLFRICQEALTNSSKHAKASLITIELDSNAQPVIMTVSDNGSGFDQETLGKAGEVVGMGLLNMREMTELSGGKFRIESSPGKGTRIEVKI
ncbi:MAG: PAS domain S-box protein [Betaproteobacteria bacterium]|nr:PAS domain S-box protein [Betaproteobacteria bacterium]